MTSKESSNNKSGGSRNGEAEPKLSLWSLSLPGTVVQANGFDQALDFILRCKENDARKAESFLMELLKRLKYKKGENLQVGALLPADDREFDAFIGDEIDDKPTTLVLLVPGQAHIIGHLIGKSGSEISKLEKKANVTIRVESKNKMPVGSSERRIYVVGSVANCVYTQQMITKRIHEKLREEGVQQELIKIVIPHESVPHLIGKGGSNIKRLQEMSGARIQVEQETSVVPGTIGRSVTIQGNRYERSMAQYLTARQMAENRSTRKEWQGGVPQPQGQGSERGVGNVPYPQGAGGSQSVSSSSSSPMTNPPVPGLDSASTTASSSNAGPVSESAVAKKLSAQDASSTTQTSSSSTSSSHATNTTSGDGTNSGGARTVRHHSSSTVSSVNGLPGDSSELFLFPDLTGSSSSGSTTAASTMDSEMHLHDPGHMYSSSGQVGSQPSTGFQAYRYTGDTLWDQSQHTTAGLRGPEKFPYMLAGPGMMYEPEQMESKVMLGHGGMEHGGGLGLSGGDAGMSFAQIGSPPAPSAFSASTLPGQYETLVPDSAVAHLIGRSGSVISDIQRKSGTKISFARNPANAPGDYPGAYQKVTIVGNPYAIQMAQTMISEKLMDHLGEGVGRI